jgi:putative ABC transport system permease protein
METVLRDVRYAATIMRRNPGFTAAGLLTLALGIGATTAVFSIVYGVLMRPLPYRDSDRLMRLSEEHPGGNSPLRVPMLSNLTYHAWSRSSSTIEQIAAYSYDEYTVEMPGGAVRLIGAPVTPSLFGLLDATPALGRFFLPEDARAGADNVVVLSDRLWRERFGGDANIIGRSFVIDGRPRTIVGVARPGFEFPAFETRSGETNAPLWTPLEVAQPAPDAVAGQRGRMTVLFAVARLRPGIAPQQAEAEGTAAARSTVRPMAANLLFGVGGAPVVHVRGVVAELTARVRPSLLVLGAAVVCVLMIACANVASLFLVRGVARQRELTVRTAIGASRARLVWQLLTESAVFSAAGGALGLALAWFLVGIAPVLAPRSFPRLDAVVIDGGAIALTGLVTIFTALVTGLAPAVRSANIDLQATLHGGDGASAGGFRGARATWWRDTLLVGEAAFAVLLLVVAVLLARSFVRLLDVDPGYTAENVLVAEMFLPEGDGVDKGEEMRARVASIVERARALPGVVAAGAGNMMPLDAMSQIAGFPSPWTPPGATPSPARSLQYVVTPGYPEALGLRFKRGRSFREGDLASDVRPWIVNEEFARLYLPPDPIGYRWKVPATPTTPERMNEIIGVIANVLKFGNDAPPQPEHYMVPRAPMRFYGHVEIAVRTNASSGTLAPAMRDVIRRAAPNAAVETIMLSRRFADSVDQPRFALTVMAALAVLAVALASVGLYGVLSYGVSQRRRELGVRAALGAARRDLVLLVVGDGLRVTAVGLAVGIVAAAALTRFMRSALFGVEPLDVLSFLAAPIVLGTVAAIACLLPARRAASTDPAEALRTD